MKIILTYVDSEEAAEQMAEALLQEKLAARVGILPGKSRYWWEGEVVKNDNELHLIIKTTDTLAEEVLKRVEELHSYDLPAIDLIDVEKVNPGIEEWLSNVTKKGDM